MCMSRTSLTSLTQTMSSCASMTRYSAHSPLSHSHLHLCAFTGITVVGVYCCDRFTAARTAGSSIWRTPWCATAAGTMCSLRRSERQSGDYFSVWFQGLKNLVLITTLTSPPFYLVFLSAILALQREFIVCMYLFWGVVYSLLLNVFFIIVLHMPPLTDSLNEEFYCFQPRHIKYAVHKQVTSCFLWKPKQNVTLNKIL